MKNIYLKFVFENRVVVIDPDVIKGFRIDQDEDGSCFLTAFSVNSEFIVEEGSFQKCQTKLTYLQNTLDIVTRDIV